jgi:hypothetical protein
MYTEHSLGVPIGLTHDSGDWAVLIKFSIEC